MAVSSELILILIPLVILELGLRIFALISILKAKTKEIELRLDPIIWIIIVLFVNFGWLIYFIFGRKDQ